MEKLLMGDYATNIVDRGEIDITLEVEENEETKEIKPTGRTIPNEFSVDLLFENIEEENFYHQWFLLQEERELKIERGNILMTLRACVCRSFEEEEGKVSRCLIAYEDVDIRCV